MKKRIIWKYRERTSPARVLPEVIVIGAQKAGTTSLFYYLSQNPGLVPSVKKEVHYFDGGLDPEHDDFSYMPKELIEEWISRDPIENYEKYLLKKKILTKSKIEKMLQDLAEEIKEATEYAEKSPFPTPEDCMQDLFA